MRDYYQILGVKKTASPEEIRRAYYKLAHQHHPDKGGNEQKFKEINEAYQMLSDKDKREQYDQYGRVYEGAGSQPGNAGPGWDFNWAWGNRPGDSENEGFGFDFGDIGDVFEEFFGFGAGARARKEPRKGKDFEIGLEIPLEETLSGHEKEIILEKFTKCQRCQGSGGEPGSPIKECFSCRGNGQVQQIKRTFLGSFTSFVVCPECKGEGQKPEKPCNVCSGEGRLKNKEKIKVFIPAGIDQNQIIKIEGVGDQGKRGAKAGDLYVRVIIKEHPLYQRRGDDLFTVLPISLSLAVLGGEAEITDLNGQRIILSIPAGAEHGKMLRLSGKGVPHFRGTGLGNLYVELNLKIPKKLTPKQKELLEKLRNENL